MYDLQWRTDELLRKRRLEPTHAIDLPSRALQQSDELADGAFLTVHHTQHLRREAKYKDPNLV